METLKLTKQFWISFGFYYDEQTSFIRRYSGLAANLFIIFNLLLVTDFSILFLYKNCAEIPQKVFHSLFQISVEISTSFTYILLSFETKRIIRLTKYIQQNVNQRLLSAETIDLYENAEKCCNNFTICPIEFGIIVYDGGYTILILMTWIYQSALGQVDVTKWLNIYVMW